VDANLAMSLEGPQGITPMVLSGPEAELVWLFNTEATFIREEVSCKVTFSSLGTGAYKITWYDLRTGGILQEDSVVGPQCTVQSPPFSIFVAATVKSGD